MNSELNPCQANDGDATTLVKDRLIDMISTNPDLPTLGSSLSNIVQLSSSEEQSTNELTNLILADVALTQKIIRLANSVTFRGTSNQIVTNISRAIQLLGLNTIKACALGMILVDKMPGKHTQYVKKELMFSLTASLIGRQLAKRSSFPNAEEVAIAALFRNMGRLLLAAFDHNLYRETMELVKQRTHSPTQASLKTIGCSFDTLTEIAMQKWLIPEFIINAMKLLSPKTLTPPKNRQDWMRQATEFSESSAHLICNPEESKEQSIDQTLIKRFGNALNIDQEKLDKLIVRASEEMRVFSSYVNLQPSADKKTKSDESTGENDNDSIIEHSNSSATCHASGKPYNAIDQLMAGMSEINTFKATENYKANELLSLVLKILYQSLGFNFATICLKDIKTHQYRARQSLGNNHAHLQRHFAFSDTTSDLFSLSIKKNTDLSISDTNVTKVKSMLPNWHLQLLPHTQSFVILPLVVNNKAIGVYYFDRQHTAPEGISPEEMKIIKILKNQALAALN
ncbi:MAG: HDOD domain-containing protein [Nitrosomonas sp. PRO4]|nr:HDOD domain-containing protein [Nitrosomonas sp. PRO4]